jgi:MYXO-CTERM domain-containing protein
VRLPSPAFRPRRAGTAAGSDAAPPDNAAGMTSPDRGAGWSRALIAAYAFMALAAGARAVIQIATEFDAAPLAFTLSAASAAIYLLAAVALRLEGRWWWAIGTGACSIELAGVLAIGTWSLLDPALFPAATVWSGFGSGYGCFPLALPLLGLLFQWRRRRPSLGAWKISPNT